MQEERCTLVDRAKGLHTRPPYADVERVVDRHPLLHGCGIALVEPCPELTKDLELDGFCGICAILRMQRTAEQENARCRETNNAVTG